MTPPNDNLTLDDLCQDASRLLQKHGLLAAQPDGRVTSVPDPRTVRYYGTLGLVDKPRIVDREARYGWRHMLQLLAVKALQYLGMSLVDVQQRLYGMSEEELEALLKSVTDKTRPRPRSAGIKPMVWREISIEPGVKVLVQDGWTAPADAGALVEQIRAAIAALSAPRGGNES